MIFHPTSKENIFNLAPIPVYKRIYEDDIVTNRAYDLISFLSKIIEYKLKEIM